MGTINENCSVCGSTFEVQFRYQMEEREGGFSFFCSQKCLEASQKGAGEGLVTCDACATRFKVELVSQVLYLGGRRRYACSLACRGQIQAEARGAKLGEIASSREAEPVVAAEPVGSVPLGNDVMMMVPAPESKPVDTHEVDAGWAVQEPVASPVLASAGRVASVRSEAKAQAVPVVPMVRVAGATQPKAAKPSADLPRYLAVFNHKGGTGKTTTSVSVAAGLAAQGKRVLLVDTDAQGNVSVSLNVNTDKTLYHVLVMGLPVKSVCHRVRENLDLVASNETLAAAELYLAGRQNRDRVLRDRLAQAAQSYDYVVLDCSPSLSLMNQNALVFADSVLVPVACDFLSLAGVRQVVRTVRNVNQLLHHPVKIWGVLPTFYDARANICRDAVETLQQHFGERCLSPIRQAIKVKEAPAQGQTIFEYAPGSLPAEDYRKVVERILTGHVATVRETRAEAAMA